MINQNYVDLKNQAITIIRDNMKLRNENSNLLKKQNDKLDAIKNKYANVKSKKRDLEYLFLMEQNILNKLPLEAEIKRTNLYNDRLEKFAYFINEKGQKHELKTKKCSYEFNASIQTEAVSHYDYKMQIIKQRIVTLNRFVGYMNYLKEDDIKSYNEKIQILPKEGEIEELKEQLIRLEQEKALLLDSFKNERFVIEDADIFAGKLISKDIRDVVFCMYPGFKNNILELEEQSIGHKKIS